MVMVMNTYGISQYAGQVQCLWLCNFGNCSLSESLMKLCYGRWLKQQFQEADVDKNGSLNYEECLKLLKQLNVKLPKPTVKRMFDVSEGQTHQCHGSSCYQLRRLEVQSEHSIVMGSVNLLA